jgi:hypothetical protein
VSGKSAGGLPVSGPPLHGKGAAAATETSFHIKRTPVILNLRSNDFFITQSAAIYQIMHTLQKKKLRDTGYKPTDYTILLSVVFTFLQ